MPKAPKPTPKRTKHYFREWREKALLTQEQAMLRLGWSQSKISRIENGKTPFDQDDLAAAAFAYGCSETDLIQVDPTKEGEVIDLVRLLKSVDLDTRKEILDFAAFKLNQKKAG